MKMDCCLFLCSLWCHLCCTSGLTLIPGSRSLRWENDTFLQQIVWLMKTILLKLIAGTVRDPKPYLLDLFKLQCLFLTFGQDCATTVHCHQNEQLQKSHQTSGMAFSPALIQWLYAKRFAPSAGHESLEKDKWTAGAVIFEMPLRKDIPEFPSKGTQSTLGEPEETGGNMVAFLMEVSSLALWNLFLFPRFLLRDSFAVSCEKHTSRNISG